MYFLLRGFWYDGFLVATKCMQTRICFMLQSLFKSNEVKGKKKKKDSNFTQNVRVYILSLHIFTLFSLEIILLLWHFCWWLLHLKVLLKHLSLILAVYTLSITFLSAVNSMQLLQSSN